MGLKANDLVDLVADIISIDEYESKIDEDAIVVALYVKFKEPALDLNKFIQKVGNDILDTDVSPSVTENGDYVVFIEMYRNDEFITDLFYIMKYISDLCGNTEWYFTCYGHDGVYKFTEDNLETYVRLNNLEEENIIEFFDNSLIDSILIEGNKFSIIKNNKVRKVFEFIEFPENYIPVDEFLTEQEIMDLFAIENLFGNITAEKIDDDYVLYNGNSFMKVKEL